MRRRIFQSAAVLMMLWLFVGSGVLNAQTPTPTPTSNLPPHIAVEKQVDVSGEVCPGFTIDVSITLTGSGTAIRLPVDAVCVIDESGSMTWGSQCGWNAAIEPPYGPVGVPPYVPDIRYHPFVDAVWASWKFYEYFVYHPPTYGYEDYGGLVFYSNTTTIPGQYPVPTAFPPGGLPETIQRVSNDPTNAAHKQFWWYEHLALEAAGGGTAMGPGMQIGRDMLNAMPTHPPPPTFLPGTPTPVEPLPAIQGTRYMVVMTDGRANAWWPPGTEFPGWTGPVDQCIEMARRLSLSAPWGFYTGYDTKIFSIGLGAGVDHGFMRQVADPWNPAWYASPTPSVAIHGAYHWARTEDDLIDVFEDIAADITSNRAGSDIMVTEFFGVTAGSDHYCPDGFTQVFTEIKDGSWNMQPTVLPTIAPSSAPEYIWSFGEMRIGDVIELTFQLQITGDAPTDTYLPYIECPQSGITYTNFQGTPVSDPIIDPGIYIWPCGGPTRTPTATPPPTATPTCLPTILFEDGFESGSFSEWSLANPAYALSVWCVLPSHAHSGGCFAFFAGCEELVPPTPNGAHEAKLTKVISLNNPIRQGAALEFYAMLDDFTFPQKKDGSRDASYDVLMVVIDGEDDKYIYEEYTYHDMVEDEYIHIRIPMNALAGDDVVKIHFMTYFPYTVFQPGPTDPGEPKVFIDDVRIVDYCYDELPTPTATAPPPPLLPTSSPRGIMIMLFVLSLLILVSIVKRGVSRS